MTVSIGLGPNFSTCSGLGWVESVSLWVGLYRVTQNGPMDKSAVSHKKIPAVFRLTRKCVVGLLEFLTGMYAY